jgi:hypothetical protein
MKWIKLLFKKDKKEEILITTVRNSKVENIQNSNSFSTTNVISEDNKQFEKGKAYTDTEIRQYINEVVREAKDTSKVDTGYLQRSIRGNLFKGKITFRQIYYGAENGNSKLTEIAQRLMPKDLEWKIILQDDEGRDLS